MCEIICIFVNYGLTVWFFAVTSAAEKDETTHIKEYV